MTVPWIFAFLAQSLLVLLLAVLMLGLFRRLLPTLTRLEHAGMAMPSLQPAEGLRPGQRPGAVELTTPDGTSVMLSDVLAGESSLVLLVSASCEPCAALLSDLASSPWNESDTRLIIITNADTELKDGSQFGGLLLRQSQDLPASAAFHSNVFPQVFAVDQSGTVRANVVPQSASVVRAVIETLRSREIQRSSDGDRSTIAHR